MEKIEKETSNLKEISTFEFQGKKYTLVEPSAAMVREAKRRRGIKFVEAIKDGMFTKKQLQDTLMERSPDFFSEFNQARTNVLNDIAETEELLKELEDPEQLESMSHILVIYRAQLVEQEQMLRELYDSTAEESADNEKNSYLVYSMLRDEKGDAVAESFDDFLENVTFEFFDACKYRLLCWEHNLDPNWQEKLPEAEAMLKAQTKRVEARKQREEEEKKAEKEEKAKKTTAKRKTSPKKRATSKKKTSTKSTASKRSSTKKGPTKKSEE